MRSHDADRRQPILETAKSLEGEDASRTSAALMTLHRWMEQVVEKEMARITAKCQRYQERHGCVPRWVERGMGERFGRAEQLEVRPVYSVGDLLTPHVDALEQEAARMGGVLLPTLNDHVGRVYQMPLLTAVSLALVASQKWHHKSGITNGPARSPDVSPQWSWVVVCRCVLTQAADGRRRTQTEKEPPPPQAGTPSKS